MDIVYTDANRVEAGLTSAFAADFAFGEDENDFEVTVGIDVEIPFGALVYIDGTPYGGIVRGRKVDRENGVHRLVYKGHTWHGILGHSIVRPDAGQDYYSVSGDANACIAAVIARQGLGALFDVSQESSGVSISYQFERYCTAYSGLAKMLSENGLKLSIVKEASGKPVISAQAAIAYGADGETQDAAYSIDEEKPVNHLVCLGEGELAQRVVVDLYADASGDVSQVQTLFGSDEIAEVYDYNNADSSELVEKGTERLLGYQDAKTADARLPEDVELDVGDSVSLHDDITGYSITAPVAKVIVKVSEKGTVTKSYKLGDIETRM